MTDSTGRTLRSIHALFVAAAMHGTVAAQTPEAVSRDSVPLAPAGDAYLDDTARRLVLGLKATRDTAHLGIDAYTAVIQERMALELPGDRRNRPWLDGGRTARFRWSREEPTVVHVLGAGFRDPTLGPDRAEYFPGPRVERFAADPLGDPFHYAFAALGQPQEADPITRSPLEPGSERHYQFRSGDTLSVRLSDDRTLRVVSVTVIPRYRSIRLVRQRTRIGLIRRSSGLRRPAGQWSVQQRAAPLPMGHLDGGRRLRAVGAAALVAPQRDVEGLHDRG